MTTSINQSRRGFLHLLGTGVAVGLAGCPRVSDDTETTPPQSHAENTASSTPAPTPTTTRQQEAPKATAPKSPDASTAPQRLNFRRCFATVYLDCTEFWIEMMPADMWYYLVLYYLDTATGERIRCAAGPLSGRVEDHFGETQFLLQEVEVCVPKEPSLAVYLPRRCLETRHRLG